MKIVLTLLTLLAVLFARPAQAQAPQGTYAITNVTVVPMRSARLIPGQTVIVRGGRIAAIGPAASTHVPQGAVRISGTGRYLMPGLAEMHAHVPPNPDDRQWTEDVLFLYAANGITFARSMLGAPHHLELRARAERGEILSPRIYTSGPSLNGNSVASPEDGRRIVAEQRAAGYDFLKIHPGLDRPRYDAIAAAAREHRIPFGGHVPEAVGLARALEAGQATIDHLDGYMGLLVREGAVAPAPGFFGLDQGDLADERRIPAAVRHTRAVGAWVVPTESLMHHILLPDPEGRLNARPEMRYVPVQMREGWARARANLQAQPNYDPGRARRFLALRGRLINALEEGGANLLLGSDAPQWYNVPGFSLHRELALLVGAGLTPYQALVTGTRNVARFIGEEERFGTVEVGRRADLILLEANPLANIANVQRRAGVMINGRWLSEERIQAGLAAIAARHRR